MCASSVFTKLKCEPSHISFFKRTMDLQSHIQKQDAIFVGGGNTKSMLAVWRDWGLDLILKDAYDRGVVMSGVSAGAICWFEGGLTDSWASDLKMMECMNFIPGNCAPHYDEEPERRPATKQFLENKSIDFMYGIEGGAALHFVDEIPNSTIQFKKIPYLCFAFFLFSLWFSLFTIVFVMMFEVWEEWENLDTFNLGNRPKPEPAGSEDGREMK